MMDEEVTKKLAKAAYSIGKVQLEAGKQVSVEVEESQILINISDGKTIQIDFVIIDENQTKIEEHDKAT